MIRFWILLLIATPAITASSLTHVLAQSPEPSRPNIILINFDDADSDLLSRPNMELHYPTLAGIARTSTHFINAHATTPFCAPSRAALFTGKYCFNNGCKVNTPNSRLSNGFWGGYPVFKKLRHHENELGVWMQEAGYHTIHVGKYHHHNFDFMVPPGWDAFNVTLGNLFYGTYMFSNIGTSEPESFQNKEDLYVTEADYGKASIALGELFENEPEQPFFLSLAPLAPHLPGGPVESMVEDKYQNYAALSRLLTFEDPDFDEIDMSDKPLHLQRPPLEENELAFNETSVISRMRSIKSVDDMLAKILGELKDSEKLENTMIIVTSDNGYSNGHHRLIAKLMPFSRSTNIPMFIHLPGQTEAKTSDHLLAQLDLCPTILEAAGAKIPDDLDGISVLPLVDSPDSVAIKDWRRSIMIENWADKGTFLGPVPAAYTAERFHGSIYVGWANGAKEFYNLRKDPFQLENQFAFLSEDKQQRLAASLRRFRNPSTPELTFITPTGGSELGDMESVEFSGYVEDNSTVTMCQLFVKSYLTGRFFDGQQWHDEPRSILVSPDAEGNCISTWKTELRVYTEAAGDVDFLICYAQPIDDQWNYGDWQLNVYKIENRALFAEYDPSLNGQKFEETDDIRLSGYLGQHPDAAVSVAIYSFETNQYFNGSSLQDEFVSIPCEVLDDFRWKADVQLPPGEFSCYLTCWDTMSSNYQRRPEILRLTVESTALVTQDPVDPVPGTDDPDASADDPVVVVEEEF